MFVKEIDAADLHARIEAGEDIGLATVYRVLTQFESAGLVTRHNFEGGHSVFELDDGEHQFIFVNPKDTNYVPPETQGAG